MADGLFWTEGGLPLTPCGSYAPVSQMRRLRSGREELWQPRCNRPAGHDGNHAWSSEKGARTHEWTIRHEMVR